MEKWVIIKSGRYRLSGVLTLPKKTEGFCPLVVMCHGFTGNKAESHFLFTKTARFLAGKNIASLRFDFMGSGDSEGSFEKMTLKTEMNDGKNAIAFLEAQKLFKPESTGILGFSMGAVTASYIASACRPKSLVLWSPVAFPSELSMVKEITPEIKRRLARDGKAYFPRIGHYLGRKFFESVAEVDPLKYAADYRGNVLIIHTRDQSFGLEHPLAYFKAFHKNALLPQLLVLDEGRHTFVTEFSEKTLIEETASFFSETLR